MKWPSFLLGGTFEKKRPTKCSMHKKRGGVRLNIERKSFRCLWRWVLSNKGPREQLCLPQSHHSRLAWTERALHRWRSSKSIRVNGSYENNLKRTNPCRAERRKMDKQKWTSAISFGLNVWMDGKGAYILSGLVCAIYMSLQYLPECWSSS